MISFRTIFAITWLFLISNSISLSEQTDTPTFSHSEGRYEQPIAVYIGCSTPNSRIYFTTDGSDPSISSSLYTGLPILVSNHVSGNVITGESDNDPDTDDLYPALTDNSLTLKAIAVSNSTEQSEIATVRYVIDKVDCSFGISYDLPTVSPNKHILDIYQPKNSENTPVLIFIHGGAWKQGDKNMYMELGNTFAGYYNLTTVLINYRLSAPPYNAVHPTHIYDVAKAFHWVYDNIADYGGDPDKIYIFGQSAGAHLSTLLATDDRYISDREGLSLNLIKANVSMSGLYDLYDVCEYPNNPLGLSNEEVISYKTLCLTTFGSYDETTLNEASPQQFINSEQPPMRLINLKETLSFKDMPGFTKEAQNFRNAILDYNESNNDDLEIDLKYLTESDIPELILDLDFGELYDGHYEEIYVINTLFPYCKSVEYVIDFLDLIPEQPCLAYPSDEGEDLSVSELLMWHKSSNADYYEVQLSTDPTFSSAIIYDNVIVSTNKLSASGLQYNTEYFWRVKGFNNNAGSDWSETFSFSTGDNDFQEMISYQGFLNNSTGSAVSDGNYQFQFLLYNNYQDDLPIWTESHTVSVDKGYFNVILGTSNPLELPFDQPYWIGMKINDGEELLPRRPLTGSPYSIGGVRSINGQNGEVFIEGINGISVNTFGKTIQISGSEYSDIRFKENIMSIENAVEKLSSISGYYFNWKDDDKKRNIGVIAQEIEKVFPEIVFTDQNGYKSVDYSKLSVFLLQAIKEQQTIIEKLQEDMKNIENAGE
jgi:hypothetical protein